MRFGKRSKAAGITGIRLLHEREVPKPSTVATAERVALLQKPEVPRVQENPQPELPPLAADPTQRLLTALGRFQRQVSKAESSAAQDMWCDECMNQLISGIELAHSQGWDNVREALTDTARILQSYEEAGRAAECRAFLQESYEILCLMVGDIIVDNTRSGVMQKWRERYELARKELLQAGLSLVDDEEEARAEGTGGFRKSIPQQDSEDISPAAEAPAEETDGEDAEESLDFLPDEEELEAQVEEEAEEILPANEEQEWREAAEDEAGTAAEECITEAGLAEHGDPSAALLVEGHSMAELREPPFGAPEIVEMPAAGLFETEAALEAQPDDFDAPNTPESPARVEMPTGELEGELSVEEEYILPAMSDLWESESSVATAEAEGEREAPAEPADTQEEGEAPAEPAVSSHMDESTALFQAVQGAVSRGDVARAKVLALQLAAAMAKLEVDRVQHDLDRSQQRLEENGRATEQALQAVREAEENLQEIEQRIAEAQAEFESRRQHSGELRERIVAIEAVIEDIDAQILALQERRDAECGGQVQVERDLEEALAEESRVQTGLEELAEAEQQRQQGLEEARQRVEQLKQQRELQVQEIAHAEATLHERVHSAGDIQRTLGGADGSGQPEGPVYS